MTIRFLLFVFLINQIASKYFVVSDITADTISSLWAEKISNLQLQLCKNYQSENNIGQQSSAGPINWKNIYSLPKTNRIYVYFEYQISGGWNNDEIEIFSNGIKVYSEKVTFSDPNKQCTQKFFYESYIYFTQNIVLDTLTLELQVLNTNLGLYIKNIVITYQQQRGRNEMLSYQDPSDQCGLTGSVFNQYYCKCGTSLVYQNSECKLSCDQNFLYSSADNACYEKTHCSTCLGLVKKLVCDVGYYFYTEPIYGDTYCLNECPLSHYQDEIVKDCKIMKDYLSTNENGGYPVLQFYFYLNIHNFLHHFDTNEFYFSIKSIPEKAMEREFFYREGSFHIGSWDTFQSQTLIISQNIKSSQYKLRFRAKAYFIDFAPTKCNFYINGVLQNPVTLQVNPNNQKDQSMLDYYAYFDFYWVRSEQYPVVMNTFLFEIEQPLQNGEYIGYFYIDELNVFQFECQTGCNACFTYKYCNPCFNPAHKNPSDCSCISGYAIKNDICIDCPIYCSTCDTANVCVDCKASTLRMNSPVCDICPTNYYLKANTEDCQPCITGCKVCSSDTSCTQCQNGYFRDSSNICINLCTNGYFNDPSDINDPKCTICDNNCLNCQNLATTCTGCKGLAILVSGHCYICNDGQYLSGTTCLSCIQNCQICQNTTCSLCSEQFFYKSQTNECLAVCDDGYFGNTTTRTCDVCNTACLTCIGGTYQDCLTCQAGKFLNISKIASGECNSSCFIGQYKLNGQCPKCWKGCYSCFDDTSECLVCATKYFRLKSDNQCYEKCPDKYYNNSQGNLCSSCDIKCKTCNGFSEINCLSCDSPLVLYQKQCVTDCPESYGNSDNVCVQCAPNCSTCFGTQVNQCLSCSTGFYYLNNQCYLKCPTFFIGIRPQYVCKCIYENCIQCTANQYFLNNVCYRTCPLGYYGFNGLCIKCDITCGQCFGEGIDECLSCSTGLILFQNKCIPNCFGNLYHDIATNECKYCNLSCLACTGPYANNCSACPDEKLLSQNGLCQENCSDGEYVVLSEKKCYLCDSSCDTCFGQSFQNCLTCPQDYYYYLSQCVESCPDGFVISSNGSACTPNIAIVIAQCAYQCQTCELTARFCKKCAANRSTNPPACDCQTGYFDDGVSSSCPPCVNKCLTCSGVATHCLKCKGDRLLPNCECPKYHYDDEESVNCTKCQDNCETCNSSGCITCLAERLNPPNCECPDGYYEAYTYYCQLCSQRCITCSGTSLLCLTCFGLREKAPICDCPSGYFENSEIECQKCDPTCIDCDKNGCLSCFGNRVGPYKGQCLCDDINGISRFHIGQIYCTDCSFGIPYFGLIEDFTGLYFEFGGQVTIPDSITDDLCTAFFEPSTLAKLGTNPQCNSDFIVIFGENPTIKIDDMLQLKNVFTLSGCNSEFTNIFPLPLKIPPTIDIQTHLPIVKFKEIIEFNVCEELTIVFDKLYFNGGQKFTQISWFQALPITQKPEIQSILQDATTAQSDSVFFPSKIFDSGAFYKISVQIQSFANLQNTISFQFEAKLKSTLQFQSNLENNQFHRFDNITIPLQISYYNCYLISEVEQILSYEILLKNTSQKIFSGTITQGIADGFKYEFPIYFDPYYFKLQNFYSLILNAKITKSDETTKTQNIFDIFIVPSSPILKIEGGNRMVGFTENLHLNSIITDPDLTKEEASNITYTCYWSCQDIVNGTTCLTENNQTLNFDNNCNQTIPGRSFAPYKVLNFEFFIIKVSLTYSTKVSIQFIEIDLPLLTVIGPSQDQLHNYYDEFIYQVIYTDINPDILMYAGAIIYDQITTATFQFYYLEFKFKIQNYFTDFDFTKGNSASLRLSVYDPRFIMPSLNTLTLKMNLPPLNCILKYKAQKNYIEFLDTLRISVEKCEDENTPLSYSVSLFPNSSIYQRDLEQSNFYNYQLLVPSQENSNFSLILPFYNKQNMLLVFRIQDSLEGIVNITKSISVKQYLNISEQDFRNYQKSLKDFDYILIGYDLITQRLKQIQNLNDYKIELLQELMNMDQNQTMLSNQTETLYHCIFNIISQNVSLIQYNETLILQQLNYRIELAKEKLIYYTNLQRNNQLTSLQNVDKSNYVKQYYTFSHILSSCINYRVVNNVTATDIQDQLTQMINYLQDISVANEPMFKIQSNSVDMNFGFLTSKMVNDIAGATVKENSQQSNETTNFYKFSQTRFLDNPFYATKGFPKNSSGYQAIDPKMINLNSSSTSMNLSSTMKFKFPINKQLANNSIPKCVTQVSNEVWNTEVCKTNNKNGEAVCECDSLNPTSIMESLDFIADKAAQVFSLDTFLAFGSFPFYKTYIFYFYLIITIVYLFIVKWGIRVDNEMFTKVFAEQDLLEQQKKLEEQKQKEQEELGKNVKEEKEETNQKRNLTDKNEITFSLKKIEEIKEEDEIQMLPVLQKANNSINKNSLDLIKFYNRSNVIQPEQGLPQTKELIIENERSQFNLNIFNNNSQLIRTEIQKINEENLEDQIHQKDKKIDEINLQNEVPKRQQKQQIEKSIGLKEQLIQNTVTNFKAYLEYLKFFHQILSIIYKSDQKKPRGLRASIVYTSMLGSLAVLFVFNQPNNLSFTIVLALITAPVNKIYQIILEKMLSHKKKPVRAAGAAFMISCAGLVSYVMLAGLVMMDSVETANQWSYIFIGTLTIDNIFYTPIQLVIQYLIHMELIKIPLFQKLLDKILDEKAKEFLYGLIDDLGGNL